MPPLRRDGGPWPGCMRLLVAWKGLSARRAAGGVGGPQPPAPPRWGGCLRPGPRSAPGCPPFRETGGRQRWAAWAAPSPPLAGPGSAIACPRPPRPARGPLLGARGGPYCPPACRLCPPGAVADKSGPPLGGPWVWWCPGGALAGRGLRWGVRAAPVPAELPLPRSVLLPLPLPPVSLPPSPSRPPPPPGAGERRRLMPPLRRRRRAARPTGKKASASPPVAPPPGEKAQNTYFVQFRRQ